MDARARGRRALRGRLDRHRSTATRWAPASGSSRRARGTTGGRTGRLTRLGHLYEAYGFSNQGFHVFLAEELVEGARRPTPTEQDLEVGRFTPEELWGLVAEGRLKDAPSLAALALCQRATPSTART